MISDSNFIRTRRPQNRMHLSSRMRKNRRLYLCIPIFLIFSGCWPFVSVPKLPHELDVSGRLMFTSAEEKRRADFRFTEYEDHWTLKIWGRFGIGRVTVLGTEGSIVVRDAAGHSVELQHLGDEQLKEGIEALLSGGVRNLLFLREHNEASPAQGGKSTVPGFDSSRIDIFEETRFERWIVAKRLRYRADNLELLVLVDDIQSRN